MQIKKNGLLFKWLEKQAEARKMTELPDEFKDLTADEKNLDWLKEKAKLVVNSLVYIRR